MAAYPPPAASLPSRGPSTSVELHISCKGLRKADVLSKSDPLAAVYTQSGKGWAEVSKKNNKKTIYCLDCMIIDLLSPLISVVFFYTYY